MWKKIIAASAAAVGIAGILGSGSAFADPVPYNGEILDVGATSVSICFSNSYGSDYSGEPLMAFLWGDNFSKQITFDNSHMAGCQVWSIIPSGVKLRYIVPMGMKNPTLTNNEAGHFNLKIGGISNNYVRSYGQSTMRIARMRYRINFDMNGGTSGYMSPIENVGVGDNITLSTNTFLRTGYRFAGWNTKADGTGTAYADGATITLPAANDLRLYAQWERNVAVLGTGQSVNGKLKEMAGSPSHYDDVSVKAIKEASALPAGFDTSNTRAIISDTSSPVPIYAWFDDSDNNGDGEGDAVIYYYSNADVVEGGSNMRYMFKDFAALTDISALANWDTSNVTDMRGMFYTSGFIEDDDEEGFLGHRDNDALLSDISALANWDTSAVTDMSDMFWNAASLANISALANWDTSAVTDMSTMFRGTKIIDVDALETTRHQGKDYVSWDTSNVTDMSWMFDGASSLSDISALASWDMTNVEDISNMFDGASSLSDISALASWDVSHITDMQSLFSMARSLADISAISGWDTSNVNDMSFLFNSATSLTDISALTNWNTSAVTEMNHMFKFTNIANANALRTERHAGNSYVSWDVSHVKDMSGMFSYNDSLSDISALASWNTSAVEKMREMFDDDDSITDISALAGWNTSSVTDIAYMFFAAASIRDVSVLENWDVSNVTTMSYAFGNLSARPYPSWYHN